MEITSPKAFAVDKTSSVRYIYFGEADPGAQETSAIWRLARYDRDTGRWTYALGDSGFVHAYSTRLSVEFS